LLLIFGFRFFLQRRFEVPNAFPQALRQLRDLLSAEQQSGDDQDDDKLGKPIFS